MYKKVEIQILIKFGIPMPVRVAKPPCRWGVKPLTIGRAKPTLSGCQRRPKPPEGKKGPARRAGNLFYLGNKFFYD